MAASPSPVAFTLGRNLFLRAPRASSSGVAAGSVSPGASSSGEGSWALLSADSRPCPGAACPPPSLSSPPMLLSREASRRTGPSRGSSPSPSLDPSEASPGPSSSPTTMAGTERGLGPGRRAAARACRPASTSRSRRPVRRREVQGLSRRVCALCTRWLFSTRSRMRRDVRGLSPATSMVGARVGRGAGPPVAASP